MDKADEALDSLVTLMIDFTFQPSTCNLKPLAEEATESKEGTLLNWSDILLQKLHSYGEPTSTAYASSNCYQGSRVIVEENQKVQVSGCVNIDDV